MYRSKKLATIYALAALAVTSASALAPQAAQAQIYHDRVYEANVAHAALNPNDTTSGGGTTPTAYDTTAYGAAFDQMKANMDGVATGPVGLGALGLMIIGVIFSVVWRLIKKGGAAVGK